MATAYFRRCAAPHIHGQQRRQQQAAARNAAAQPRVFPPHGGQTAQRIQRRQRGQYNGRYAHKRQAAAQMLGAALFRPERLVAVRLRLGRRLRRTARLLRFLPQLLGILRRTAADMAAGHQSLKPFLQRGRRLKNAVVIFGQYGVHRVMHHIFQGHTVRRKVFFIQRGGGFRGVPRLERRCGRRLPRCADRGKFRSVLFFDRLLFTLWLF